MLHVGLNLIFLVPGQTGGMEVYARELVPRLAAIDDLRVTAFVNREAAGEDFGCEQVVVPVAATSRLQWVRGEQLLLPRIAAARGIDLLHSLGSTAPVRGAFEKVVTVHDLMYKVIPDAHFGVRGLGMRVLVPAAVRTSDRVIAISDATREDLRRALHVPETKVAVVPQGVSPATVVPTPETELRGRLDLGGRRVLLTVSAKRPHKNLLRLIEAFALLREPRPVLVLPGYPTPHEAELRARAEQLRVTADVRFPAWVSSADLEGLYRLADAFVFPSLYEGFGLPVLEAMARGVPVATSGRGSLSEVAGDAALLFDPESVPAITAALRVLLEEPAAAADLRERGSRQASGFTWDQTASRTRAVYAELGG